MKIQSVKYICDRCGKEVAGNSSFFFKQGVTMERVSFYGINPPDETREYTVFRKHRDLCKECRKNLEVWLSGKNA